MQETKHRLGSSKLVYTWWKMWWPRLDLWQAKRKITSPNIFWYHHSYFPWFQPLGLTLNPLIFLVTKDQELDGNGPCTCVQAWSIVEGGQHRALASYICNRCVRTKFARCSPQTLEFSDSSCVFKLVKLIWLSCQYELDCNVILMKFNKVFHDG